MAARLLQLTDQAEVKQAANELVTLVSTEIRRMDKVMRIFGAGMLTKVSQIIPTQTVIQMMQKESMFEQKFVQIGVAGAGTVSKIKTGTQEQVQSKTD